MILWFVVGLVVWILCVLFILAILKGGNITTHTIQIVLDTLKLKVDFKKII